MSEYVPASLRRLVMERARAACEYCLIHERDTEFGCQVDHIISEKHGGPTTAENLAYACVTCNRYKGSDIGSVQPDTGQFVRFFNPRTDRWQDHFRIEQFHVIGRTQIGEVTVRLLRLNYLVRLEERTVLGSIDRYPPLQGD